ncbi:acyltransferase family protein [Nocardioides caeni]|uniref:Acyltransferase n=1 Tax=Nocardioides caeni TaxID=574700 RepID=A0A4S8N3A3_9ACTN|nr:acyltransferase [Nocardioides caeni]THV09204.1 acyltransferase [Nocardioides caeni]
MSTSTTRRRSIAIDLVRVIAIFIVVLRHTWYDPDGFVAQIACPWAIAVFFVLTGYLWSEKRTMAKEFDHRASTLMVPFVCWMVLISIPFFAWAFTEDAKAAAVFLPAFAYGAQFAPIPYSACWFFSVMFCACLIMRFLGGYARKWTWLVIGLTLVVTVVAPTLLWFGPLGSGLALACLLFIAAGQELKRYRARITHPFVTGLLLAGASAAAIALGASHDLDGTIIEVKTADFGFPVAGLVVGATFSIGLLLLCESLERFIPEQVGPFLVKVAGTATFAMFLHPVLLLAMGTDWDGGWPDFLVAYLVPIALCLLLQSRGWLPWLTGDVKPIAFSERLARRRTTATTGN